MFVWMANSLHNVDIACTCTRRAVVYILNIMATFCVHEGTTRMILCMIGIMWYGKGYTALSLVVSSLK